MLKKKRSDQTQSGGNIEEIVAEIFCSKRYTGQFEDSEDGDEIDFTVDALDSQNSSSSGDDWTVHDFDESRD